MISHQSALAFQQPVVMPHKWERIAVDVWYVYVHTDACVLQY